MANAENDAGEAPENDISQSKIRQVIGASSAGTVIEWYDFYIFGSVQCESRIKLTVNLTGWTG